jgi:hypothetical protein
MHKQTRHKLSKSLTVKHREVQSQAQTDGVCWREASRRDLDGGFVGDECLLPGVSAALVVGKLGEVSVVVALHLVIEDLALVGGGRGNQVLVEDVQDIAADVGQLLLDLLAVRLRNEQSTRATHVSRAPIHAAATKNALTLINLTCASLPAQTDTTTQSAR